MLWDRLFRLKARGKTLVITTHYMDEAEQLCDRLVVMDQGRIVAEGSPLELILAHSTREVAELRFGVGDHAALAERVADLAERVEVLPDRCCSTPTTARPPSRRARARARTRAMCSCAARPSRTCSCGSPDGPWSIDGRRARAAGAAALEMVSGRCLLAHRPTGAPGRARSSPRSSCRGSTWPRSACCWAVRRRRRLPARRRPVVPRVRGPRAPRRVRHADRDRGDHLAGHGHAQVGPDLLRDDLVPACGGGHRAAQLLFVMFRVGTRARCSGGDVAFGVFGSVGACWPRCRSACWSG